MAKTEQIMLHGRSCRAERVQYYVKRGEYTHGYVKGWQLVDAETGAIVISGDPGRANSAYEYQKPRFATKAALLEAVEEENKWGDAKRRQHNA